MKKIKFIFRYLYHLMFSNFHELGWRVLFGDDVQIHNAKYISIGSRSCIDNHSTIAIIKDTSNKSINFKKPLLKIGKEVGIGTGTNIYCLRSIHINNNVMIGPNCFIGDYDHGFKDKKLPIAKQPLISKGPVVIGNGSWLGAHVAVCSGVTIGRNVVIGANSVVTKDIPDYSVAVGIPAKVIKTL